MAGDKRCSLNKLKKIKDEKDISMASPEEVKTQTGYTIGGVSPIGHLNNLEIIIDNSLKRFNDCLQQLDIQTVFLKLILKIFKKLRMEKLKI